LTLRDVPVGFVSGTAAVRAGRLRLAEMASVETLWRAAIVFLPLALLTALGPR
jgi:hypothetical protein